MIAGANGTSLGFSPELTLGMTLLFLPARPSLPPISSFRIRPCPRSSCLPP
ncbi:hypothetical protein MBH78_18155 [Oceanimonas sp. NS1]|nr:hypothetical protein [Oceanimonas sp. NS1]